MSDIEDLENTAAANNAAPPNGAPEGMDRSDVNNVMRETLAKIRRDWEGTATGGGEWRNPIKGETITRLSSTQIRVVGVDVTAFFPVGRKLKITHATGNPVYCFVSAVAFTTDTDITVHDFDDAAPDDEIRADADGILFHAAFGGDHGIASGAFDATGGGYFEIPATKDSAGINAAITAAQSNGSIVLLEEGTYTIDAIVSITGSVAIWGRGWDRTVLQAASSFNNDVFQITGTAADIVLRDFQIDGQKASQTAGNGIVATGTALARLTIEGLYIKDCFSKGIQINPTTNSARDVFVRGCVIEACGDHGIQVLDPDDASERVFVSGCMVLDPGEGGAGSLGACGIILKGKGVIADCVVRMNQSSGSHVGSGIRLEQADTLTSPSSGGHHCQVSNCRIEGTTASSKGVFIGGSDNIVTGCFVSMSGALANPLEVDGRSASAGETALRNQIIGCVLQGGNNNIVASDAQYTAIRDCRIHMTASPSNGIAVFGDDTEIRGCVIDGGPSVGVLLQSGASDSVVVGNRFKSATTDITDNGTNSVVDNNHPQVDSSTTQYSGSAEAINVSSTYFTGYTSIALPGLGANGQRKYRARFNGSVDTTSQFSVTIYYGSSGTPGGDTTIGRVYVDGQSISVESDEFVPASGDAVSVGAVRTGAATNLRGGTLQSRLVIEKVSEV